MIAVNEGSQLEFWTVGNFVKTFPGTSRKKWLVALVPLLVKLGVLVKSGRGWWGRRGQIETALLGKPAEAR